MDKWIVELFFVVATNTHFSCWLNSVEWLSKNLELRSKKNAKIIYNSINWTVIDAKRDTIFNSMESVQIFWEFQTTQAEVKFLLNFEWFHTVCAHFSFSFTFSIPFQFNALTALITAQEMISLHKRQSIGLNYWSRKNGIYISFYWQIRWFHIQCKRSR